MQQFFQIFFAPGAWKTSENTYPHGTIPHALQIWLELRVFIFVYICDSVLHHISKEFEYPEKTSVSEKQMKKIICAVLVIEISFSLVAGQNSFLSYVRHVIEFAEFPIQLTFDLGEVQPKVLFCNQIYLKVSAMDAF